MSSHRRIWYCISSSFPQLEQDFEIASNEYEYINNALKTDLPEFLTLATRFIDPLFHSFFYMQCVSISIADEIIIANAASVPFRLNIFYMMLEKLSAFADGKYEVSVTGEQIALDYEAKRSDAYTRIEQLGITSRVGSTCTYRPTFHMGCS